MRGASREVATQRATTSAVSSQTIRGPASALEATDEASEGPSSGAPPSTLGNGAKMHAMPNKDSKDTKGDRGSEDSARPPIERPG